MTIRGRVVKMFSLMGTLMLVQMAAVLYLHREGARMRDAAAVTRTTVEHLDESQQFLLEMLSAERGYAATGDRALLSEYSSAQNAYVQHRQAANVLLDPEGQQQLSRIDGLVQAWIRHGADAAIAARDRGTTGALTHLHESGSSWDAIHQAMERLETREFDLLGQRQAEADRQTLRATMLMLVIPVVCMLALVYLSIDATVHTLRPMGALGRSAQLIAQGEFVVPPADGFGGEVAVVRDAFALMATAIQQRERDLHDALARERDGRAELQRLHGEVAQQHARLLATLETVPAALVILDPHGRIVLQNKAAEALLGRPPEGVEAQRVYWRGFFVMNKDRTPARPREWAPLRALGGETVMAQELSVRRPNGKVVPIVVSAAPLRDEAGRVVGAVSAFQDVTPLLALEQMKTDFVATVSHELRTPLTSVRGALQLVLADEAITDPDQRQLLTVALNNAERLIRIVNDILDISKIESGRLPLDKRPCRVEELLRVAQQSVAPIAAATDVRLESQLAPDLRPVLVDFDRIVQALVNLLSNAVKFAPAGSAIHVRGVNGENGTVDIAIQDTGAGISAEDQQQLFQKFQQVDGSASRRVGGTGLGLSITKALVEQHGGSIAVQSEVGAGSTFTIRLPAADAVYSALRQSPESDDDTAPIPNRPRVLIAEDDEGLLIVLTQTLTRGGLEVDVARNGHDAWTMAARQPPALLVLDLAMPQMDGFEVIRRLRANARSHDLPIIAISGSDKAGPSERRAREAGANSFLPKPLDANGLVHEVQRLLAASPAVQ
jgi:PAS domain S-box-containing protein